MGNYIMYVGSLYSYVI